MDPPLFLFLDFFEFFLRLKNYPFRVNFLIKKNYQHPKINPNSIGANVFSNKRPTGTKTSWCRFGGATWCYKPRSRGTTVVWKFSQNSSGLGNLAFPYVFINYCVSSSCFFGVNRDPLVVSHSPTAIQCFSSPLLKQRLFHGFLIQQSILHLELTEFFSPNLDFVS